MNDFNAWTNILWSKPKSEAREPFRDHARDEHLKRDHKQKKLNRRKTAKQSKRSNRK